MGGLTPLYPIAFQQNALHHATYTTVFVKGWIDFQESNEVLLKITVAFTAAWKWIYITYVPEKWRIFLFANMALKMNYLSTRVANWKDKLR